MRLSETVFLAVRHTQTKSLCFLFLLFKLLGLEGSWLGELKYDGMSGQSLVSMTKSLETGFHNFTIKWVKEDLLGALSFN